MTTHDTQAPLFHVQSPSPKRWLSPLSCLSLSLSHTAEKSKVITCLLFAVYYNKKGKERQITATVN